jgi:hypothetical protein
MKTCYYLYFFIIGTSFDVTDPEIAGQDIFQRLVPMEAHEASSLYRSICMALRGNLHSQTNFSSFHLDTARRRQNCYAVLEE